MEQEDINRILDLRKELIDHYQQLRDYKTNKNALMKEIDHAARIHKTIVMIDNILKDHVIFS